MDIEDKDINAKPELKLLKFPGPVEIDLENDLEKSLITLYLASREVFSMIEDEEMQSKAVDKLRQAFLLALNPLSEIDKEFDINTWE
jgi:hypothetical protein